MARKNVLFPHIDCLRADAAYGEGRQADTPTLDAICRQGTVFTQAISVAGSTPVCLASLFTGVYPYVHGIRPLSLNRFYLSTAKLNPRYRTLAEILRDSGYATSATVTGPILHVTELDRGFQQYQHRRNDDMYLGTPCWGAGPLQMAQISGSPRLCSDNFRRPFEWSGDL